MVKGLPSFAPIAIVGMALMLGLPAAASAITPDVATLDTYSTAATTATVEGAINPNNESTTYAAQYDLASSTWCTSNGAFGAPADSTTGTDPVPTDSALHFVTVDLTALSEGVDYCAELTATNGDGTEGGGQVSWTQGAPTVDTNDAGATGDSTAAIDGDVNPAGNDTSYAAEYDVAGSTWCTSSGTSGSPAHTTPSFDLGTTDGSAFHDVSVDLTGLSTSTNYCGAIVATNVDGVGEGDLLTWSQPTTPPSNILRVSLSGSVKVTSSPAGIDCGTGEFSGLACAYGYAPWSEVTLTATQGSGFGIVSWTGCSSLGPTSARVCNVLMSSAKTVTANFTPLSSTLTVSKTGTGTGTVTSTPSGIDCGSTCSYPFPVNSNVSLVATPSAGSYFAGWLSADCSGKGGCTTAIPLASETTVTATFTAKPPPKPVVCVVPRLKGKPLAAAKIAIRKHHCAVGKITRVNVPKRLRNHVLSQHPRPGRHLRRGSKIALKIGK